MYLIKAAPVLVLSRPQREQGEKKKDNSEAFVNYEEEDEGQGQRFGIW